MGELMLTTIKNKMVHRRGRIIREGIKINLNTEGNNIAKIILIRRRENTAKIILIRRENRTTISARSKQSRYHTLTITITITFKIRHQSN